MTCATLRHRRRATGLATDISYILEHELTLRGIPFEAQKRLAVVYKGQIIGEYIADLVIDGKIIPSTRSGQRLEPETCPEPAEGSRWWTRACPEQVEECWR